MKTDKKSPSPQPKSASKPQAAAPEKVPSETKTDTPQPSAPIPEPIRGMPQRQSSSPSERMSLKIVDDKFDRKSLRPESAERLKQVLVTTFRDEQMRQWIGVSSEAAAVLEVVPPALVGNILDMAARVEASILSKRTRVPYEKCLEFLEWDVREHETLDKQGAAIIAKYIPAEWLVKADLWIFLSSLISLTSIKISALSDYAKKLEKTKVDVALESVERATKKDEERNAATATAQPKKEPETFEIPLEFIPPPPEESAPKQSFESPNP